MYTIRNILYSIEKYRYVRIQWTFIKNIENKIIGLVDEIIKLKKLNKDTQYLEDKIDEMVYDLYELTEEERELRRNFK